MYVLCSSPHCMKRPGLKTCTLMWLIILITFCKALLNSVDTFQVARISLWMTDCINSHSETTFLTQVVKPESHPVITANPSMHIPRQNNQFTLPDIQ